MSHSLIAVGRLKPGPLADLFADYAGRLRPRLAVVEVEEKRKLPAPALMEAEARLLLRAVPAGAARVVLDSRGRALSSEQLAVRLGAWRDEARAVAFLIGGAEGLDASVREGAALTLSLGPMTWPHLLVRAMLAEQLYRAQSILAFHPYHRG